MLRELFQIMFVSRLWIRSSPKLQLGNNQYLATKLELGFTILKIKKMILSTTDQVPGREIETILGISQGSTVRARNIGRDFMAGLKNIVGGEISEYTILLAESRDQAIERMVMDAEDLGANAIVNIRFQTAMVMQGCSEILAYGTAVKLK
jgi:uncharacterized protein YbjQ (UPF0145 family)